MRIAPHEAALSIPDEETNVLILSGRIGIYSNLVLLTLLVYDSLIMLGKEVAFLWDGRKLGTMHFVFFVNRYAGIAAAILIIFYYMPDPSSNQCNLSLLGTAVLDSIIVISIDYILMMRVLALYHNEKRLQIFLWVLLVSESVARVFLAVYSTISYSAATVRLATGSTACITLHPANPAEWDADWILPLAYGALLLALAIYKAMLYWRAHGLRGSTLVFVLIKDQVLYFGVAISCSVFNIILRIFLGGSARNVSTVFAALGSTTLLCILGSRMLFNLKDAAKDDANAGANWPSHSHTNALVQFSDSTTQGREDFSEDFSYQMETWE